MSGVFDLQLLHIASQIARGEKIPTHLTGLAKVIQGLSTSFLSYAARNRMDWNKREAQRLFAPEQGGSYDVWFTRPLSAILIEYLTDVHIFSHLLTALLPEDQRAIHRPAIERASSRRLNIAHALDFSKDNPRNKLVDDEPFIDEIVSNCSSSVRTRISNERAELLRIQALPVKDRVRTRGGGPSAMQEVSEALRGHRTIQPVILWDVVQFICAHNRWFSSEDYMAFLELAMSSYYLTIKQRQTCSDWRSRNGAHKNQRYTDDECYDYDDADSD
ncbi:hypothetical protein CAOG_08317 [Capsaspora owczarzaki ATCC 30864]|uniref:Uncharacterized protein n=1 Tax=Capsaspora owczarzaki (strain ATCC 30864) TaxID=595528 RepID=A0A0D2W1X5_CAPO3|nr:hypothetical protein CAOG_08317 [Capsaspora owczarzaki ATCC 30864]KJE98357.1 hypothetical protein CAOG_008317 [Capsaspora owczarzaki ATCC 30864]|eukprot:XP_004341227.1 hypothetical protein CAOG_08317 [Capsaspora owczarzaki ATCC 30864]